jgi:hypothetical protein
MLPARISTQFLWEHETRGKIPQSVGAGAIFSPWIRIFGANRSPKFTLQLKPTFLGGSRRLGLPLRRADR